MESTDYSTRDTATTLTSLEGPEEQRSALGVSAEFLKVFLDRLPEIENGKTATILEISKNVLEVETLEDATAYCHTFMEHEDEVERPFVSECNVLVAVPQDTCLMDALQVVLSFAAQQKTTYPYFYWNIFTQNFHSPSEELKSVEDIHSWTQSILEHIDKILVIFSPWPQPLFLKDSWCMWLMVSALVAGKECSVRQTDVHSVRLRQDLFEHYKKVVEDLNEVKFEDSTSANETLQILVFGAVRELCGFDSANLAIKQAMLEWLLEVTNDAESMLLSLVHGAMRRVPDSQKLSYVGLEVFEEKEPTDPDLEEANIKKETECNTDMNEDASEIKRPISQNIDADKTKNDSINDANESKNIDSSKNKTKNIVNDKKSKNTESDKNKSESKNIESDVNESKNIESDKNKSINIESDIKESKSIDQDEYKSANVTNEPQSNVSAEEGTPGKQKKKTKSKSAKIKNDINEKDAGKDEDKSDNKEIAEIDDSKESVNQNDSNPEGELPQQHIKEEENPKAEIPLPLIYIQSERSRELEVSAQEEARVEREERAEYIDTHVSFKRREVLSADDSNVMGEFINHEEIGNDELEEKTARIMNLSFLANLQINKSALLNCIGRDQDGNALFSLLKAVENKTSIYGQYHKDVAAIQRKIATIYDRNNCAWKALQFYEKALATGEHIVAMSNPLADLYWIIADFHFRATPRRLEESVSKLSRCLEIKRAQLLWNNEELAVLAKLLGDIHLDLLLNIPKCLELYEQSLVVQRALKSLYGDEKRAKFVFNMALLYMREKDVCRAISCLEYVKHTSKKIWDINYSKRGELYGHLGTCYLAVNQGELAAEHFLEALKTLIAQRGEMDDRVALCYNNIAHCYQYSEQYSKAIHYYSKDLDIQKQLYGEEDLKVARLYAVIGELESRLGNAPESFRLWSQAYNLLQRHLGTGSPETRVVEAYLEALLWKKNKGVEAAISN